MLGALCERVPDVTRCREICAPGRRVNEIQRAPLSLSGRMTMTSSLRLNRARFDQVQKLKIVRLTDDRSMETIIPQAAELVRRGGVLVCATDTGYLLGVDGLNRAAIEKVYAIKGRAFHKPIHLVAADQAMAATLVEMDAQAARICDAFLPGPLTVILKKQPHVPDILVSGLPGLGLRIPANAFLLRLVATAGVPLTATSANRSGLATPYSIPDVLRELGPAAQFVDLFIDQGETEHAMPSTILDLTQTPPQILRAGPITAAMLRAHGILENSAVLQTSEF